MKKTIKTLLFTLFLTLCISISTSSFYGFECAPCSADSTEEQVEIPSPLPKRDYY